MKITKKYRLNLRKRGLFIQSRGYLYEFLPNHPHAMKSGYIFNHRRIWSDKYGKIPTGFIVHHKNEKRQDNRLSNLECVSRADHMRIHKPHGFSPFNGKPIKYVTLKCFACKKSFQRRKAVYSTNSKVAIQHGRAIITMC